MWNSTDQTTFSCVNKVLFLYSQLSRLKKIFKKILKNLKEAKQSFRYYTIETRYHTYGYQLPRYWQLTLIENGILKKGRNYSDYEPLFYV